MHISPSAKQQQIARRGICESACFLPFLLGVIFIKLAELPFVTCQNVRRSIQPDKKPFGATTFGASANKPQLSQTEILNKVAKVASGRKDATFVEDALRAGERGKLERGTRNSSWKVEALVRGTPKDPGPRPPATDDEKAPLEVRLFQLID